MRGLATATVAILVVLLVPSLSAQAGTEAVQYYPKPGGWPAASLTETAPTYSGPMYDVDSNGKQGRRIDKSDKGLSETDKNKYHQWSIAGDGLEVTGSATFTIWYADKSFDDDDDYRLEAYLLDCGSSTCVTLATTSKNVTIPEGSHTFRETTLAFPSFDHTFASGRSLTLRIMVDKDFSDDDMTFAYGTVSYPSVLKLSKVVPPPTTTTTTTTTTSTTSTTSTTTTTVFTTTTRPTTATTAPTTTTTLANTPTTTSTTHPTASSSTSSTTTTTAPVSSESTTSTTVPGPVPQTPGPPPPSIVEQPESPDLSDLDTGKANLVITTSPSQRGVAVAASGVELSPLQGLMVTFVTAAETVQSQLLYSVALGLIMAGLLVFGMARRNTDEDSDGT